MKRFCSIMTQLLQVFPRNEFYQEVKETKAERHARGFASWDHFVAMLFCQLADAQSLREIIGGLTSCEGRLEQFGMKVPKRSTLAYANRHRPWELFRNVFYKTSERCRAEFGQRTKFRFKNRLLSIDSSVVTLCSKMFPWATWSRQKGAVKLHLTLDHAGYLPEAMVITTGKYSELTVARRRRYARGTILVMDRGFVDFYWFDQLNQSGVVFITRIKKDTAYAVAESHPIVPGKGIVWDERIQLTGKQSRKRYPEILRLVTIETAEGERLQFLTNHMTLAASTIADIYKDRWQIETFFKLLKQNLHIKSFVGTSANAVWIQIWTALIAILLIKFLQLKARFGWSFSNLVYFLRMNLLVYRDLWDWLHDPFTAPPPEQLPSQLDLGWS
ncbi:MAG TPA: IS4 family transposase [Terriglobia bacterium]|nr:IS4 family transposase [Terriglobia bacterium]